MVPMACKKILNSHPRQWVDSSRSFLLERANDNLRIPPTAVGGSFKSFLRSDLKYPPTAVGWDYSAAKNMFCRQHLKKSTNYRWWNFHFLCKAAQRQKERAGGVGFPRPSE